MSASPTKISAGGVKKARNAGQKVVTANRLADGMVIYFTPSAAWSEDLAAAHVVEGEDAMAVLAQATADESQSVGPYLMDVAVDAGGIRPTGRALLRETIRDRGPTIHPEFGRQAALNAEGEERRYVSV